MLISPICFPYLGHQEWSVSQVAIVGSGNVGANTAFFVAKKGVTDVLLTDVREGIAQGKVLDLTEAAPILRYRNRPAAVSRGRGDRRY